jgi:DnaJ family protein C protein 11
MSSNHQSGTKEFPGAQEFRTTVEDDGLDADYSMVGDYPEEPDYYVLLGLSRNPPPTEAEIRSAYRNLTLSFHPDKQPPHLRHAAESQFRHIQEAYETLIDPNKRVVYDISGAAGVRQEWGQHGAMGIGGEAQRQEVGVKAMSPDQFRRWFLKTMKKRERKAVESLVSSKVCIFWVDLPCMGSCANGRLTFVGFDIGRYYPRNQRVDYGLCRRGRRCAVPYTFAKSVHIWRFV